MSTTPLANDAEDANLRSGRNEDRETPRLRVEINPPESPGSRSHSPKYLEADAMTEHLFSIGGRSTSTWPHDNIHTPTSYDRRASQDSDAASVSQLRVVVDELTQSLAALTQEASSTTANETDDNLLSPHALPSEAARSAKQPQAQFLASAKKFMRLASIREVREILQRAEQLGAQAIGVHSPVHSSTPTLDPRLDKFYDAAGDVKLQGEKLVDLDYWYAEQVSGRMFLQDQGLELADSDEQFRNEYLEKRAVIEAKLDEMIEIADAAKAECQAAELDLNAGTRAVDDSETEGSNVSVDPDDDHVTSRIVEDLSFDRLVRRGRLPSAMERPGSKVVQWIEQTPTPGDEYEEPSILASFAEAPFDDVPVDDASLDDAPVEGVPLSSNTSSPALPILRIANPPSPARPESHHEDSVHTGDGTQVTTEALQSLPKSSQPQWLTDEEKQNRIWQIHGLVDWELTPAASTIPMPTVNRKRSLSAIRPWTPKILALSWAEAHAWIKSLGAPAQPSGDHG